jgi:Yip1 domain
MDEQQLSQPTAEEASEMSFSDKLMNVFASPGELFTYVARTPKQNVNWSISLMVACIVGVVFTLVTFSQPAIQGEMHDRQEQSFRQKVEQGQMTQDQADAAMNRIPSAGSPIFLLFGSAGVVIVMCGMLFLSALVFWLVGKIGFESSAPYSKVCEVVGLSMFITSLGTIIAMILVVAFGTLSATPSLALVVSNYDPTNKMDRLLSSVNVITFWYLTVVSVGLSKVFTTSFGKTLASVAAVWAIWTAVTIYFGFGF